MLTVNGIPAVSGCFPDGTLSLRCITPTEPIEIEWRYECDAELVTLIYLTRHFQAHGMEDIALRLPYVPNARMDRVKNPDELFTLKYFAQIINGLNYTRVIVRDAHSNVALALIDRVESENLAPRLLALKERLLKESDIVFFPDEGAGKRYSDLLKHRYAFGMKKRDWRTGKITGLDVYGDVPSEPFNALIIDDISSFGGTFFHAASKLRELGAEHIYLYVTHCEHNILEGQLAESGLVERVFTTKSIFFEENDWVEILP